jgi:lipopolysaccharide transport protein LptA
MGRFIQDLAIFRNTVFLALVFYTNFSLAISKDSNDIEVWSERLSFDRSENIAEYIGGAKIRHNGTDIYCDRAQVFFSGKQGNKSNARAKEPKSNLITIIKFYNNVFIDSKTNKAYSDYGVFTKSNNLVILEQNVKLKEKNSYMTGGKLTYNIQTHKMKMVNNSGNKRVSAVIQE